MPLDDRQLGALKNLARKASAHEVDWINIADARSLTIAGFAERDRHGWHITPAGTATLAQDHP